MDQSLELLLPAIVIAGVWLGWRGKVWLKKANQRQNEFIATELRNIDRRTE